MAEWLLNGEPDALITPTDRGFLFGDGVFETIAFHRRRAPLWSLHMRRLARGCEVLGLPPPDPELLLREAEALVGEDPRIVIRIALSRGSGGRGYFPPAPGPATRFLLRRGFPADLERRRKSGVTMRTSPVRLGGAALAGLKHASRLEQVLIARDLAEHNAEEALVLDGEGALVEGLHCNLVIERGDGLLAPVSHPAAVAGVGLEWLRQRAGASLIEQPLFADSIRPSDSVWMINSVQGPIPAHSLDGRALEIGPLLRHWQRIWRDEIEK
ncbi:MAG: aminotransferase class IV [Wenzhouxiangellaceae bacterium]